MKKPRKLNLVGRTLRQLRLSKGLTQAQLAARCGVQGWDVTASTLAKIETNLRSVYDAELIVFARALQVPLESLFPEAPQKSLLRDCLNKPARR